MNKTELNRIRNGEMVTISRAEYEEFQAQRKKISELESRVDLLMEALRLARHKQFGASSEKSEDTLMEQLSFLFNEAEAFCAAEKEAEENATVVAAHKRHKKHEYTLDNIPEDMPKERMEHRLEGETLVCPQCGKTMTEIGTEVINKLKIIPAQTIVEQHVYYTYACKSCSETQMFQTLFDLADEKYGGSLPMPVHFLMDEFANVSLPDDFAKILSVMRSRNVFVSIILQNITQLKALFEKEWESIMGNCVRTEVASAL